MGRYLRIQGRSVDNLTLSPKNIAMMKAWIEECEQGHGICKRVSVQNRSSRPRRLLHVGDLKTGLQPRLILTETIEFPEKYAALSYCWGPPSKYGVTTTRSTIASRISGLLWDEIPATFKAAFRVCKALDIEYIWIDSLCIIQEDDTDWRQEAAIMGDIYRQAYVTLVAASSNSVNDGFLARANPADSICIPFKSGTHPQIRGEYSLSFTPFEGYLEAFSREVAASAWDSRGWTFQERFLSRRMIFFAHHQMHFECRMHRRSESYGSPLKLRLPWHRYLQRAPDMDKLGDQWRRLVEQYSQRSFTFEKDRLPALAGLVFDTERAVTESSDEDEPLQYLCGHWNYQLWASLLWIPMDVRSDEKSQRATLARIPSWSWCSRGGRISFVDTEQHREYCKIVPRRIGMTRSSIYGITQNILEINGHLMQRTINEEEALQHFQQLRSYEIGPLEVRFDFHLPIEDFREVFDLPDIWLAPLAYCDRRAGLLHEGPISLVGLALSPGLTAKGCDWETDFEAATVGDEPDFDERDFRRIGVYMETLPRDDRKREQYVFEHFKKCTYRVW